MSYFTFGFFLWSLNELSQFLKRFHDFIGNYSNAKHITNDF